MDAIPLAVKEYVEKVRSSHEPVLVKVEQITEKLCPLVWLTAKQSDPKRFLHTQRTELGRCYQLLTLGERHATLASRLARATVVGLHVFRVS